MGTVIQATQQRNYARPPRWERFERADRFEPYRELRAQGMSQRQVAQELQVPRTTLQAWRPWHDTLDICPDVAQCFHSGPGLAFVHRLVMAFHLVCLEVGACGVRLACLFRTLSGLDRLVAASSGAQHQGNRQGEEALVAYRHTETTRLATDRPRSDLTVTQAETFTGGLCLVTMDPDRHCILVEQLAEARDHTTWNALLAPALAQRTGPVMPSTSEEAPGRLAYVAHDREAHHAPDVFHGQHELRKAVAAPMATKERAVHKAVAEAQAQIAQVPTPLPTTDDEPAKRGPSRSPKAPGSLAYAQHELEAARRAHERLVQQREQVTRSLRALGHDDHCVDLARGVRRNGRLMASDIQAHIEQVRALAQHEGRSQTSVERLEKAERVVPKRQATIAFVSRYGRPQVDQLDWTPPAACIVHAKLLPAFSLDRVARPRTVRDGAPLRELAERLRAPLFEPGGPLRALSPEAHKQLPDEAKRLAAVFQRSSANVEGRNGYLSLRNHPLRGLAWPRKREGFTTMHHFCLTRPDGTTAAERFFGQKPRSMFTAIVESVALPPAPLSPPRRA